MNNLNELSQSIYQANKAKGFWDQERNVGELLMLVTSELGEGMEAHRKGKSANRDRFNYRSFGLGEVPFKDNFEDNIKDTFEDEIADAMIRLFDLCGGLGIDIEFHIREKLRYNATREKLHGKLY